MRGDFTRDTRERAWRMATRAVLLQQGRPLLDSDINEQAGLVADRSEAIVRHVVGLRGAPRDDAGFEITPSAGGFSIGAGTIYAEGLPLENPVLVAYDAQIPGDVLPQLTAVIPDGGEAFVYVEAVLRPALDPALSDPALDGVDTSAREVAAWAVRVAPLSSLGIARDVLIRALDRNESVDIGPWARTTGGLDASVDAANPDPGPCEIAPAAGYLDQLNRLYRIEIHDGGAVGTATFKWTEDASREAGLRAANGGFAIDLPQSRLAEWFPTGAIVELVDERRSRAGLTGAIGAITSAPGAPLAIDSVPAAALTATTRVRRWAALPVTLPAGGAYAALSKGVRIRFASGHYVSGSAWTIPARTVLGDIIWPPYLPADLTQTVGADQVGFVAPLEGRRYYAALALIRRTGADFTVTLDLRDRFPPLTDITAEDVRFDDSRAGLGADDVQEAIDALAKHHAGCCTWHAGPATDLQALVDSIPARGNGRLCLSAGNFALKQPLRIAGKGHIVVTGVGQGTKLWCRGAIQALVIEDCLSAEVSDLVIAADAPGAPQRIGRTGAALDISGTGRVRVQTTTLLAQGRRWKQGAALRIACSSKDGGGDVTVADCDVVGGDLASGIIITDPSTLRITGNRIRPRAEPHSRTLDRWRQDKAIAAAVGRLAFSHAIDKAARTRPTTRRESRLFMEREMALRASTISFYASGLVSADAWPQLATLLVGEMPTANSREYRLRLRRLVSVILAHGGLETLNGSRFTGFSRFHDAVVRGIVSTMDTGIIVAGKRARDVTIEGNHVEGSFHGIRVGLGAGTPRERLQAGTLRIDQNSVRLRVAPVDIARVGIYVGNVERAWVTDNDVAIETADSDFNGPRAPLIKRERWDLLHAEGIRVYGVLGPLLHIRGNGVRACPAGITVTAAAGTDGRAKLWLVQGNYVVAASANYRLDGRCKKVDSL